MKSWLRRRRPEGGIFSFPVPPPIPVDGPVSMAFTVAEKRAMSPRLRVSKLLDVFSPEPWSWWLTGPDGWWIDGDTARTWGEALAVGLAALETATLTGRRAG